MGHTSLSQCSGGFWESEQHKVHRNGHRDGHNTLDDLERKSKSTIRGNARLTNNHLHDSSPILPLRLSIPIARKPPTPDASEFAAWKMPILHARSDGLYQNEKYMIQAGTTPLSGIPRKNLAVNNPAAFFTALILATTIPNPIMIHGKYFFPLTVFMSNSKAVTMKYVMDTAQLN
jgi:hypothetical protein